MKIGRIFFCSIILLALNGCGVKKKRIVKADSKKASLKKDQFIHKDGGFVGGLQEFEARLYDLPIPVYTEHIAGFSQNLISCSPYHFMIGYNSPLLINQLEIFFCTEMERMGWKLITKQCNLESLFLFIKPHGLKKKRYCFISLRNSDNQENAKTLIIITQAIVDDNESD